MYLSSLKGTYCDLIDVENAFKSFSSTSKVASASLIRSIAVEPSRLLLLSVWKSDDGIATGAKGIDCRDDGACAWDKCFEEVKGSRLHSTMVEFFLLVILTIADVVVLMKHETAVIVVTVTCLACGCFLSWDQIAKSVMCWDEELRRIPHEF